MPSLKRKQREEKYGPEQANRNVDAATAANMGNKYMSGNKKCEDFYRQKTQLLSYVTNDKNEN